MINLKTTKKNMMTNKFNENSEKAQTAVEWLIEEINGYVTINADIREKALNLEKSQILNAYLKGKSFNVPSAPPLSSEEYYKLFFER